MDEIEQIKQKIDIVEFINQYVPLKKGGRNFKALCPFHQEKTPSFMVSPERQIWYCFGACQEGGDVFDFLMKWEGLEFYEALKILAKRAGVKLEKFKVQSSKFKEKEKIYEINHLASELYHYLLTSHRVGKKALDYLNSRGIKNESIKTFSLGYAPASWQTVLPFFKKKGYAEEEIEKAGLIIQQQGNLSRRVKAGKAARQQGSYYDRFRGRAIFTLKDHRGNIVGFSGRSLDPQVKEAKYINTPETLTYHKGDLLYGLDVTKRAVKEAGFVIITEGEFDVISSYQVGIRNIVAIKGSALTENQVRLLKRFTENVTLALDSDLAGDAAARRGIEVADREGLFVKVIQLPQGEDADSLIRKKFEDFHKAVKSSIPVYDFFLNSAFARFKGVEPQEKKKIANELLPIWAKITDPIIQAHYLKILAQKLKVSEESIMTAMARVEEKSELVKEEMVFKGKEKSREELLEEYFLALLLKLKEIKKFLKTFFEEKLIDYLQIPAIKKILAKLKSFLEKKKEFKIGQFVLGLPKELHPVLDLAYLQNIEENFKKEEDKEKEIKKVAREIKRLFLRRKLKDLATKIKKDEVKEEFRKLTAELKKIEKTHENILSS